MNHHFLNILTLHKLSSGRVASSYLFYPGPWHAGLDEGRLAYRGAGDARHVPHLDRWRDCALGRELLPKRVDQGGVRKALTHTAKQYCQLTSFLSYLPSSSGHGVHHAVEHYGLHRNLAP